MFAGVPLTVGHLAQQQRAGSLASGTPGFTAALPSTGHAVSGRRRCPHGSQLPHLSDGLGGLGESSVFLWNQGRALSQRPGTRPGTWVALPALCLPFPSDSRRLLPEHGHSSEGFKMSSPWPVLWSREASCQSMSLPSSTFPHKLPHSLGCPLICWPRKQRPCGNDSQGTDS